MLKVTKAILIHKLSHDLVQLSADIETDKIFPQSVIQIWEIPKKVQDIQLQNQLKILKTQLKTELMTFQGLFI